MKAGKITQPMLVYAWSKALQVFNKGKGVSRRR